MNIPAEIERVLASLEQLSEEIASLATASANAEAAYKSESAKVRLRLRANGTKYTEAALADLSQAECEELHLNYLITSARLNASREALRSTQARLDGLRTLSAGIRAAGG